MDSSEFIGIIQTSYTISLTFVDKPDEATRARLKKAGFQFDRGRWYRSQPDSRPVTRDDIVALTPAA